jgi:type VI secretion system protein ImpC
MITTSLLETALGRPAEPIELACLKRGLRDVLASECSPDEAVDLLVASLDADLARQIDPILHHPLFQALESAWRGLWLVVSRMDRKQNVQCEVLNCSKEDLLLDYEDSPEVPKSGLYKIVYSGEYGPFGGRPFSAIFADYALERGDLPLLRKCADVAAASHTPFLAAASPALLGRASARAVAREGAAEPASSHLTGWSSFRDLERARYVGLVFPRCLGRAPHAGESVEAPEDLLWQNAIYALAVTMIRSFEVCRLPCNITGPVDGLVEDLPTWAGPQGSFATPAPVEAWLSPERETELAARGFLPLGVEVLSGQACFHVAPTLLATAEQTASDLSAPDQALHRQLPSLLVAARFAQTVKVLHREQIGAWSEREPLLDGLREVLEGWTHRSPDDHPKRPLRHAEIHLDEPAKPYGAYREFRLRLEPNWSFAGRFFTLAISGKLDVD